jgi:hypothetical protein
MGATTPNERRRAPRHRAEPSVLVHCLLLCYGAGLTAGVTTAAGVVAAGAVDVPVTVFFWVDPSV